MLSAKPWQVEAVITFCGVQVLCFLLGMTAAGLLHKAGFAAFQPPDGAGLVLLGTLGLQGATWVLIPFFLRYHQVGWREAFGVRAFLRPRTLWLVGMIAISVLPVVWCLQFCSIEVLTRLGWPPEEQMAVTLISDAKTWWMQIYLGLFAVVLAPVAEEFIFRGLLYPCAKQFGYPRLAVIGVSLAFALIHWDTATFVPLFVLALALTWLYEMSDSLLAPMAAHSLFNAANLVVLHFQSQISEFLQNSLHMQWLK